MRYNLPNVNRNRYFQPRSEDMPEGGDARHLVFQFNPLAPMDVQQITEPVHRDTVFYSRAGNFTGASGAGVNVFTNIYHIHNGQQLPIFTKPSPLTIAFGTGARPNPFIPTHFVPAGDSLMMEVRSQDRVNSLDVETVLFGTTVNYQTLTRMQKIVLDAKRQMLDAMEPANKDVIGDQAPAGEGPFVRGPILTVYPNPGDPPATLFSYIVPPGQRTRIFEHALQSVAGTPPELSPQSRVTFRFLVDGWPLEGLGAQTAQIGTFATPDRVVIWLQQNQNYKVTVELPAGAVPLQGTCGYRVNGWTTGMQIKGTQ